MTSWFFVVAFSQLPPPTPVTLGPGTQIVLKLIDQAPQIITAIGLLLTAVVGLLNFKRLGQVQTQTDGHMTAMLAKQSEMARQLADSVPAAALTAVVTASAATATAAAATHASDRASDRAADRATDRAADRAAILVGDRRDNAPAIKVAIVSAPDMTPTGPASTQAIAKSLDNIDANTAATAEGVQGLKAP